MFKINDKDYEIQQAYIDAMLDDENEELIFGIEIEGKRVDDFTLPSITSDTLLKIKKYEIKEWRGIAGRIVEWGKYSKNIWKPYAKFVNCYKNTFRGNFLYNAKIEFTNINNKIFIKIKGLCDSKFNCKEIKTLSLDIETEMDFTWIQMGPHETEEAARNRLHPYLDTKYFNYDVSKLQLSNNVTDMGKFIYKDIKKIYV
ncbi:MAG: hypothetical protein LBL04_18235 [Bacteroidales bacterium]|jgi:hypothetical protein|nr:hypothetical protein [Bacteroidales bacterium]